MRVLTLTLGLAWCWALPALAEPAPAPSPRAPQLEKLAEREAMQATWAALSAEQKAQAMASAKQRLESMKPKEKAKLKGSGDKEVDAIQGALKRIRTLPAKDRDQARANLRRCIDHVVPPPGAASAPLPAPVVAPQAPTTPSEQRRCLLHKAGPGCR